MRSLFIVSIISILLAVISLLSTVHGIPTNAMDMYLPQIQQIIAQVQQTPSASEIDLSGMGIGKSAMDLLCQTIEQPGNQITRLALVGTAIPDPQMKQLANALRNQTCQVEEVDLTNCRYLSKEYVDELKQSKNNLHVILDYAHFNKD